MIFGLVMLPSLIMCIRYSETESATVMMLISLLTITGGLLGSRRFRNDVTSATGRICIMATIFTWITLIVLSAMPYYFSGIGFSFTDCLFESAAGWTTTGASVIGVYNLPVGLQLWRSTTNWMGGIGLMMLTLTFLVNWQFVGRKLVYTEIPGPGFMKSSMTFRKGFRRILAIYLSLTVIEFVLLLAAGMPKFQAALTALSSISTAGLEHIHPDVLLSLDPVLKAIISVFTFIGGINCSVLILLVARKWKMLKTAVEFKYHAAEILITAALFTAAAMVTVPGRGLLKNFGDALMEVISYTSTSGYDISDMSYLPYFCRTILFVEVFIGACAVSTGGGIKMSRIILMLKTTSFGLFKHKHPNAVKPIRYGGITMKNRTVLRANIFGTMFLVVFLVGAVCLSVDLDVEHALTVSQAMITNNGNVLFMNHANEPAMLDGCTAFSKVIMCVLMLAGRLEIYPVIALFSRSFWISDRKTGD